MNMSKISSNNGVAKVALLFFVGFTVFVFAKQREHTRRITCLEARNKNLSYRVRVLEHKTIFWVIFRTLLVFIV